MIANAKFMQPIAVGVNTGDQLGSRVKDEAVRYDLSIEPIVVALRDGVARIAAQMVLVVAGSALGEVRCESAEHDSDVFALVSAIRAPVGRVRTHHHLTEAARLIGTASTQYWNGVAFRAPHQIEAILRPLKTGWWHLQTVASRTDVVPLVDISHCCGFRCVPDPTI